MEHIPSHSFDALAIQAGFEPKVVGTLAATPYERIVICGMGGSRLPGLLLRGLLRDMEVHVHAGYGLPHMSAEAKRKCFFICSSFSGNTAETLDAFASAQNEKLSMGVVTSGGALLVHAQSSGVPHVVVPEYGIPPREAVVVMTLGVLALLQRAEDVREIQTVISQLSKGSLDAEAESLITFLSGKNPLLYGPQELEAVLQIFKVNFNETSRRPAYIGILPEINHNEVEMYDGNEITYPHTRDFAVLLFLAEGLDLRIAARTKLLADILSSRGVPVRTIHFEDWSWKAALSATAISMIASGLWASRSDLSGAPANIIDEFKERMKPFDTGQQ